MRKENKKVVVHPVAIRYEFPFDVHAAAAVMLDEIETRLTWRPSRHLSLHERFKKVGDGLLRAQGTSVPRRHARRNDR
ncbi:MAG: hypothetical protein QM775_18390 [Pirellulales bacterium]